MKKIKLHLTAKLLVLACLALGALQAPDASAQTQVRRITGGIYAGELTVPLNKSEVVEVDTRFKRVTVGNPEIADVLPLSDRTIYVLGLNVGQTNIAIFNGGNQPIAVVDVNVTYDVQGLKVKLSELYPNEQIEVRGSNNALILSGQVSSAERMSGILSVADQYAPDAVANLMAVRGSQQVMLSVRFAEVSRTLSRSLGINWEGIIGIGDSAIAFARGRDVVNALGQFIAPTTPGTTAAGGAFVDGNTSIAALIDLLEAKGVMRTLAEPNLIALSGDTASFLAGGEFPVPTVQTTGNNDEPVISTTFREFGVSLSFTPTVVGDGLINLVVAPEVSQIDETVGVQTTGLISIPGLQTRRARTTVELRDGESFAIAGLLQNSFQDQVQQLPWLGDLPVLGALFRSTDYAKGETELVIIVTAYLVQPSQLEQLASPTDGFVEPTDFELFFWGQTEGPESNPGAMVGGPGAAGALKSTNGGIAGSYGHIVE